MIRIPVTNERQEANEDSHASPTGRREDGGERETEKKIVLEEARDKIRTRRKN